MFDFEPFDMDTDDDVDGINFLGLDYLIRYILGREDDEEDEATEEYAMWQSEMPRQFWGGAVSALCHGTSLSVVYLINLLTHVTRS